MDDCADENIPCSSGRGSYTTKYTQDDLKEAIEKIRSNEMSYGRASLMYNVPKTTLFNRMKNPEKSLRGATTTLTKSQEDELAEWVFLSHMYGDPRTKLDIQIAAGQIAALDADVSKHFKNDIPTTSWVEGFLKRHPKVVYRMPEVLSKASSINTKEDFAGLWRNIYDYFKRTYQLDLLNKPEHWWNADETAFDKDVLPKKVLAPRGAKNVYRRDMAKAKDKTTFTYAFSAAGDYVEPLITLKNSSSSLTDIAFALGSVGANYGINQTESGWMKTDSFYYFVTMHLHRQWEEKKIPKPRILTIDGYRAHFSLRLFQWSRLNDVIIIVLYPGGTPFIQVCDTTMFGPMKSKQKTLYSQWRLANPTKNLDDVEFVKLIKKVNDEVIKKQSIINGWRGTGLQPFDFNNLNTDSLISKSPDYLYDFKGNILNIPKITTSNENTEDIPIVLVLDNQNNVLTSVDTDTSFDTHETTGYSDYNDLPYFLEDELRDMSDFSEMPNTALPISVDMSNCMESIHQYTAPLPSLPKSHHLSHLADQQPSIQTDIDCSIMKNRTQGNKYMDQNTPTLPSFPTSHHLSHLVDEQPSIQTDIDCSIMENRTQGNKYMDQNTPTLPSFPTSHHLSHLVDERPSIQTDNDCLITEAQTQGNEITSECIKLSSIIGRDGIFQSSFDTSFNLASFGLTTDYSVKQNENKISKLVDKIRHDIKDLGLLCAANDKEKLINVLIINQQLNIIDPPEIDRMKSKDDSTERTIKTILKPPTMPQRVKPKRKRNMKVAYGVVTSNEVIDEIERQETIGIQHEIEREQDIISKNEREKQICDVDMELLEARKKLNLLRSENAAKTKETAEKKKAKQDIGDAEDAKKTRLREIKESNELLSQLRNNLNELKANHTAINKSITLKRKQYLEEKKDENVIKPSLPPTEDILQI